MRWIDRPKTERRNILICGLVVLALVFVPLVLIGGVSGLYAGAAVLGIAAFFFLILLGTPFVAIAVHEVGHLLAGYCVGFKFNTLKIGPFLWLATANGVRFSRSSQKWSWSGYCGMQPIDKQAKPFKYALFILGGPLISTLFVGLLLLIFPWEWLIRGGPRGIPETLLLLGARILFGWSVAVAFFAIVPYRTRSGFTNDTALLLLPLVNRSYGEYRLLALQWTSEGNSDKACKDWNVPLLRRMVEVASGPYLQASCRALLANALLYRGELEEGLALQEEAYVLLAKSTVLYTEYEASMILDIAFSRAYFGKKAEGAEEALAKALERVATKDYGFFRATAAIALLKGESARVAEATRAGIEWLDKHADSTKPNIQACYEEMSRLIAESASIPQRFASSNLDDASGTASGTSPSPAP